MRITFLPKVLVELTADEWELYDKPGRDEAAQTLSRAASDALTQAWALMAGTHPFTRTQAHRYALMGWEQAAGTIEGLGTTDTEPRAVMAGLARDYLLEAPSIAIERRNTQATRSAT